ncbi:MAG TPA: 5-oxoprolinase subunit PxpB [Burkholderiales bacterium]|nr:5-oxoprolinase subunit PxpB [Burkholderiales bacterium]
MAEPKLGRLRLSPLGDCVLLVELGSDASEQTTQGVRAVAEYLLGHPLAGVRDVVGAVCTVALHYDPLKIEPMPAAQTPFEALALQVTQALSSLDPAATASPGEHQIPVCYGGEFGEDLEAVAQAHGLTGAEVIALHSAPVYRVQMLGFAPGFAYLVGLDARLATPRKATPRTRVPAGSVGIGGELTAVYPLDLPGGWHLIGRSPVSFFDPGSERPSLLIAGDRVRFLPITPQQYAELDRDTRWR